MSDVIVVTDVQHNHAVVCNKLTPSFYAQLAIPVF